MYKDYKDCIVFVVPVKWHKKFQAGIWSQVVRPHLDRIMERMDEIEPHLPFILLNLAAWCISYRYFMFFFFCLAVCFQQELINKKQIKTPGQWLTLERADIHVWKKLPEFQDACHWQAKGAILSQCSNPFLRMSWQSIVVPCWTILMKLGKVKIGKLKVWGVFGTFVQDSFLILNEISNEHGDFRNLSENELLYLRKWDVHSLSAESLQFRFDPFVNVSI